METARSEIKFPPPALGVRPLSPALGAEILGIDLRDDIDTRVFAQIRDAWHQNLVIVLRGQNLSEEDQVRFAEKFGPPAVIHTKQFVRNHPAVMLNALEVPRAGGNTLFANGYTAYETLPPEIKRRIDGRKALNAYDYETAATKRGTRLAQGVPSYAHPVVRTHPATGRKALYVNRLMTVRIEGLPAQESDGLLAMLFDHQERRDFIYEHVWRAGDLVIWDNRCTLHARTDFSPDERRLMRRVTILGEKPV